MSLMSLLVQHFSLVCHNGPQTPMSCVNVVVLAGLVHFWGVSFRQYLKSRGFGLLVLVSTHQSLSSNQEVFYGANCDNSVAVAVAIFVSDRKQFFWDSSQFLEWLPSKSFSSVWAVACWLLVYISYCGKSKKIHVFCCRIWKLSI